MYFSHAVNNFTSSMSQDVVIAQWYKYPSEARSVAAEPLDMYVVGSILRGGPVELFLVPASAPRLV